MFHAIDHYNSDLILLPSFKIKGWVQQLLIVYSQYINFPAQARMHVAAVALNPFQPHKKVGVALTAAAAHASSARQCSD